MKLLLTAIYDHKVMAFTSVMTFRAKGEAIRSFSDAVADKNSMLSRYPADYSLMHLGTFDDNTGGVDPLMVPETIIRAEECVATPEFAPRS